MSKNKWYDNPKCVDSLKKGFEKAGLPLEYRAKGIFEKCGFEAHEHHYKDIGDYMLDTPMNKNEGNWRQIDIFATPQDNSLGIELKYGDFNLSVIPFFIAECKFSSKKSFFVFKSKSNCIFNYPPVIGGDNLLPLDLLICDSIHKNILKHSYDVPQIFNLDVYENITEIDISKLKNKDNNYNDNISYQACEQLFHATNYELLRSKSELVDELTSSIFKSKLLDKWFHYLANNNITKEEAINRNNKIHYSIAIDFLMKNFNLNDIENIQSYTIFPTFPILVINEDAGLFEVKLDNDNRIIGFEKIKYGLYRHSSRYNNSHHMTNVRPESLGIIICDVAYIEEVIGTVLKGLKKLSDEMKKNIDEKPYLLGYELLFNSELIDPRHYFSDGDSSNYF